MQPIEQIPVRKSPDQKQMVQKKLLKYKSDTCYGTEFLVQHDSELSS